MTLANYAAYEGDLPSNYVVQPADWNGMFDGIGGYLNNNVVPAVNGLISANSASAQSVFNARLTLQTGVWLPGDVSSAGTVYLTQYQGNLIGLYSSSTSTWSLYAMTGDISLAVPNGNWDLFDIYVYWNGTALVLTTQSYPTVIATNNPAAGNSVVINVASTANFNSGDVIGISQGAGTTGESAVVTNIVTNTSVTVDALGSSYTTPTLHCATPSNIIATQNGIPVLSSNLSYRYCGTILVIQNTVSDSVTYRNLANYYNRMPRQMWLGCGAGSALGYPLGGFIGSTGNKSSVTGNWLSLVTAQSCATPLQCFANPYFQAYSGAYAQYSLSPTIDNGAAATVLATTSENQVSNGFGLRLFDAPPLILASKGGRHVYYATQSNSGNSIVLYSPNGFGCMVLN